MKRLICLLVLTVSTVFCTGEGVQTVTAGQPVRLLTTSTPATICRVVALTGNTGTIWLGFDSNVSAANKKGIPLGPPATMGQPGGSFTCDYAGVSFWQIDGIWVDATNSTDGVSFSWK